jgi:hypothetical protein
VLMRLRVKEGIQPYSAARMAAPSVLDSFIRRMARLPLIFSCFVTFASTPVPVDNQT